MSTELKIEIKIPGLVTKITKGEELYKAAFQSVFEFIESTGKLTLENHEEVTTAANNHAQAIFMAKMGMKEGVSTNETRSTLYQLLGINGNPEKSGELDRLFGDSADKIKTFKALVDSPEAILLQGFNSIPDSHKESLLPLIHMTAAILDQLPTAESKDLSLEAKIERNTKITEAVFEAIIKTRNDSTSLLNINPNYNYSGDLINNLNAILNKENGVGALTNKEKVDLVNIIKEKFASTEKAEESHHQLQEFLQTYGKWLVMLFPVIAAPLANIFSYVPIIGTPLNALLGCVGSNAPTILAVVGSSMLNGANARQAAPARDPKLDPQFATAA